MIENLMNTQPADSFSNEPVASDGLPDYSSVVLEAVAPTYRRYVVWSTVLFGLPVLVATGGFLMFSHLADAGVHAGMVLSAIPGLMIGVGLYRLLDARYRGWRLREQDIIARSGVLWRSTTVLPVARIQHVETSHGPLERAHGLARLKLYTAGGMTADLVIVGITRETADRLREYLVEQIRQRDASASELGHG